MPPKVPFLDCCDEPVLEVRKHISHDDHDRKSLSVCLNCGKYWFHRFYEHIYFDVDLPDSQIEWYVRLTTQEAKDIVTDGVSLKLAGREIFHVDEGKVVITDYPPF